jgi:hypothetical protein
MSFLKYFFDNDWKQRRDIEELRDMQHRLATAPSGGASERWVHEIADEVKELAATVHVLMRKLHEAKLLDVDAVRAEVEEELRPKPKPRSQQSRPAVPEGPAFEVVCMKCRTTGMSNEMVKVGADWLCRPCARNP